MFYSEKLLSKTGPLARVWLAANVERKLSKSQVLQSDIQQSIGAIVDQGDEPLALRLSGQLMLGVVRIYGKKAKYLQDDCHEALLKIRMTFKNTGSHDLPANAMTGIDLNLPDLLTIDDLFPSMDFAYPLTQQPALGRATQDFDPDWTSTLNPQQSTQSRLSIEGDALANDDDLGLDFGDRDDFEPNDTTVSVQYGRTGPADLSLGAEIMGGEKLYNDDESVLDTGDDVAFGDDAGPVGGDVDMANAEMQGDGIMLGDDEELLRQAAESRRRVSGSPLSEVGSQVIRDLDQTFQQPYEDISEVAIQHRQRSKKLKPIMPDVETVLHNRQIKQQAEDRSKILKAPSFLPRDPLLLTLMNMQKNGDFVTNAMNDGVSRNWAPELQGLLSFDVVQRSGNKRKRDSGIAGLSEDEHSEKSPRLDLDDDADVDEGIDTRGGHVLDIPADDSVQPIMSDQPALEDMVPGEDEEGIFPNNEEDFDETTMPLLHPADSGPVSLGTKRAVHLLREKFGGSIEGSPKKSVLLQDLVPERKTSKEDATKMFFEVLVLATKDAIKVEQSDKEIGLPLRIRGKRGLWGSWAETREEEEQGMEVVPEGIAA
jgi:cohesin complex subunit SCC1